MAITPDNDGTTEAIALFLRDYLNDAAEAYFCEQEQPVKKAVEGVASIQPNLESILKLPLLACYRSGFSGELLEQSTGVISYFPFTNMKTYAGQGALFIWVARQIAIALRAYDGYPDQCAKILDAAFSGTIRYASVSGNAGPLTIPFLRIQFEFLDFEEPA